MPFSMEAIKAMTASLSKCTEAARQFAPEEPVHNSTQPPWSAPFPNKSKISVGDIVGQSFARAAAICRDSQGRVLRVGAKRATTIDPELAEANQLGMRLAVDRANERCVVVSDAKNLVAWINNRALSPSCIVHECRSLLHNHASLRLEFGRRSSNEAAHEIGRKCLNLQLFGNWLYELFTFSS